MLRIAKYIVVTAFALPLQVGAWGFEGHEYIGETAYQYLTPEAKSWVDNHLARLDEESLATATTWADRVRGTEEGQWLGPLHFANIPPQANHIDMQRDCPNRRCVVGAAKDAIDVMFDADAEPRKQAQALRLFAHWITDLHQPLHLGFARDRGGNDTVVIFEGEESNLHRVWDIDIVRTVDLPPASEFAAHNPLPASHENWHSAVLDWASESNELAREYAYKDTETGSEINEDYIARAQPVIRMQMLRSAQRMALIINDAAMHD